MQHISPFFKIDSNDLGYVCIFLSGTGTNAEKILQNWKRSNEIRLKKTLIFTDRPDSSQARAIAHRYNLPFIENDIRRFYRSRNCQRVSLDSQRGRDIREEWTDEIRLQLSGYNLDFGIFAGFVPLSNITGDFPCLNIHPGDLTYLKNNSRYLVGLHHVPIARAIMEGLTTMRSSVIVARPYGDNMGNMDNGPVLGISSPVEIDFLGVSRELLIGEKKHESNATSSITGGNELKRISKYNQEKLKKHGDWSVFPGVVDEFAQGNYGIDDNDTLYFRQNKQWVPIKTIVYGNGFRKKHCEILKAKKDDIEKEREY